MPSWDDLRFFDSVVRAGSIRKASKLLNVDHTTVSRRVAALESALNAKLLIRTASGVELTAAGEDVWETAQAMRNAVESVERKVRGADSPLHGRVRLSTHAVLGTCFLVDALAQFRAEHPTIEVELDLSHELVDLSLNQADVALRVANAPPLDSIARRVAGFAYAVYAARGYATTHDLSDSSSCEWVGWDPTRPYPIEMKADLFPDVPVTNIFPSILSQHEATALGFGLAALPCFLGEPDDRLVRVSEPRVVTSVYLLRHPDKRATSQVTKLFSSLLSFLTPKRGLFEG